MLGLAVISSVMVSFGYSGWRFCSVGVVVWGIGAGWYNEGEVVMMMANGLPNGMASYDGIRSSSPTIN